MARITLAAYGTWGDVGPFIVMAEELAVRGHEVTLMMPDGLHHLAESKSFKLAPLAFDFTPDRLLENRSALQAPGGVRETFTNLQLPFLRAGYEELDRAADDTEVFVVHPMMGLLARMVSEKRGTPYAVGCLGPIFVPTSQRAPQQWPLPTPPGAPGRLLTRALWRTLEAHQARSSFDHTINDLRVEIGLPAGRANVMRGLTSADLLLMLMSKHFFPVPSDWPDRFRTPGFLVRSGPSDAPLPIDVEGFLDQGEPPVLVSLGHLGALLAPELFEVVGDIVDELGARAILNVGFDANVTPALRERPGVWPFVPLSSVLPRCRAVVHIGGLGTLGAILSAGTPALVLPITAESRWSAHRVDTLGVGIGLSRQPPRPRELRRALTRLLEDDSYATRGRRLAEAIRGEDAEAAAADDIERLIERSG